MWWKQIGKCKPQNTRKNHKTNNTKLFLPKMHNFEELCYKNLGRDYQQASRLFQIAFRKWQMVLWWNNQIKFHLANDNPSLFAKLKWVGLLKKHI